MVSQPHTPAIVTGSSRAVQLATQNPDGEIKSIAVCAGSGASVFKGVEADLFLTGEMSHVSRTDTFNMRAEEQHEVLAVVAKGQSVVLCNHTNTERPYLSRVLRSWLETELNTETPKDTWEVVVSEQDRDPLQTV